MNPSFFPPYPDNLPLFLTTFRLVLTRRTADDKEFTLRWSGFSMTSPRIGQNPDRPKNTFGLQFLRNSVEIASQLQFFLANKFWFFPIKKLKIFFYDTNNSVFRNNNIIFHYASLITFIFLFRKTLFWYHEPKRNYQHQEKKNFINFLDC